MNIRLMLVAWMTMTLLAACGTPTLAPTAPLTNSPQVAPTATASAAQSKPTEDMVSVTLKVTKLNLNTVTESELMKTIPGFSARMVREFLEYRPYASIQQFRKELGKYIDAKQIAEYEKYVYVPIKPNDADAATLQQIPGLDASESAKLIAKRPFASNDAFLAELVQYISAEDVQAAKGFLSAP